MDYSNKIKYKNDALKVYQKSQKKALLESFDIYKPKLVFFTGAGISAESGISTFRDSGGLWENHSIYEIATAKALRKNFEKCNDFYNKRRLDVKNSIPNNAHFLIQKLESFFNVEVITQNVDDLHERAGSNKVYHLHGEIMKSQAISNRKFIYSQTTNIEVGDRCPKSNSQLRPYIILFDELLDKGIYYAARKSIREADLVVVIGSTLQVTPASDLLMEVIGQKKVYLIDLKDPLGHDNVNFIQNKATTGMEIVYNLLLQDLEELKIKFQKQKALL